MARQSHKFQVYHTAQFIHDKVFCAEMPRIGCPQICGFERRNMRITITQHLASRAPRLQVSLNAISRSRASHTHFARLVAAFSSFALAISYSIAAATSIENIDSIYIYNNAVCIYWRSIQPLHTILHLTMTIIPGTRKRPPPRRYDTRVSATALEHRFSS